MSLQDTLVSIVIPAYNSERFLGRTLMSALEQTYDPIEVVVVDDGSTDGTAALVETIAAQDSRVHLFRVQNSGVATARNFGISKTRGELIALLDADDLWHPRKIARQVALMQASSPAVGLVYCWSVGIDENDFIIPPVRSKTIAQGRVIAELAMGNFIENSSAPLIKRSCIEAVGGYDSNLKPHGAEDWKLYLSLAEVCEFAVIPEYLVGYRQSTGSLSRNVAAMAQSTELVAQWLFERSPDLPEDVRNKRMYYTCIHLAQLALDGNQFAEALRYLAMGCRALPAGLLGRSTFELSARLLARMAGLKRTSLRRRGWTLHKPISFSEFHALI